MVEPAGVLGVFALSMLRLRIGPLEMEGGVLVVVAEAVFSSFFAPSRCAGGDFLLLSLVREELLLWPVPPFCSWAETLGKNGCGLRGLLLLSLLNEELLCLVPFSRVAEEDDRRL